MFVFLFEGVCEVKANKPAASRPPMVFHQARKALYGVTEPRADVNPLYQSSIRTAEQLLWMIETYRAAHNDEAKKQEVEISLQNLVDRLEMERAFLQARVPALDPRFVARMQVLQKQVDTSLEVLTQESDLAADAEIYFNLGMAKLNNFGNYEEALADFEKSLAIDDKSPLAHYGKGLVYARMGNNEEAIRSLNQAIALDPDYALIYYELAQIYAGSGNYQEAIENLDIFIQLQPGDIWAYFLRGEYRVHLMYQQYGKYDSWTQTFQHEGQTYYYGEVFISGLEKALSDYRNVSRLDSNYGYLARNLELEIHKIKSDFTDELFIQTLDKVTSNTGDETTILNNLDLVSRLNPGKYRVFQTASHDSALSLQQNVAHAFIILAEAMDKVANYTAALKNADKAIELYPAFARAYYLKGKILKQLEQYEAALEFLTTAIELGLDGDYSMCLRLRGEVYAYLGNTKEARDDFIEANSVFKEQQLRSRLEKDDPFGFFR